MQTITKPALDSITNAQAAAQLKYAAEVAKYRLVGVIVGEENFASAFGGLLILGTNVAAETHLDWLVFAEGRSASALLIELQQDVDFWREAQEKARRIGIFTQNN